MGKVYFVGAGPGEFELITLKGLECIKHCDVILYDRLISNKFMQYLRPDCKLIYVGKESGKHSKTQEEINQLVIESALEFNYVVRLKGGDPFVFGRGGEEIEAIKSHKISFEVIPGVTSAIAVPSSVGIPVTHRGLSQSFHVICGHTSDTQDNLTEDYEQLAKLKGTLVFLMGLGKISMITTKLITHGMAVDTPAAVISKGTTGESKTIRGTVQTIASMTKENKIQSPGIIVIGQTASCKMIWQEEKQQEKQQDKQQSDSSLEGTNVGIIGTKRIRDKIDRKLQEEGAISHWLPMEVVKIKEIEKLDDILKEIKSIDWIAFTSQNGVTVFFQWLREKKIDIRTMAHIRYGVIGQGTRECLWEYGINADFISSIPMAKVFGEELSLILEPHERVLIPRAKQGSKLLLDAMDHGGTQYIEVPIYDVVGKKDTQLYSRSQKLDWIVFCSSSGVHQYYQQYFSQRDTTEVEENTTKVGCIGEITADTLRQYGIEPQVVASVSTVEELIKQMKAYRE